MNILRRFYSFLKPYNRLSIVAMFMLISTVFFDLMIPRLIQEIVDRGIAMNDSGVVLRMTLLMLFFTVMSALLSIGNTFLGVRVAQGLGADMRETLYRRVQGFTFRNMDQFKTGQLITRMTSDVNQVQFLVMMSLRILTRAPLLMIGSVVFLWATSRDLATIMLGFLPITAVVLYAFISRAAPLFTEVQERLDALNQVLQENISGIRVVKSFVRQDYENSRFGDANKELSDRAMGVQRLLSLLFPTMLLIINLGTVAVLWFGGIWVVEGVHTIGEVLAFINYLLTALFPLVLLAIFSGPVSAGYASLKRIYQILDTMPEFTSTEYLVHTSLKGRVEFRDVCFSYVEDCLEPVLRDVSFTADPGENIAILGATGSGKSSLVHLIPRFYEATRGSILVDGVDIKDIPLETLRGGVSIAFQESFLFTGTLRDNIRFGKPDATDEEVVAAARAAQADGFIAGFPEGYDTLVGQRGVNLSGGQRQRINIARALLKNPRILILDDSTSSVDVETEAEIQEALRVLMKDRTSFVIAQRISTVLDADRIIVLDRGTVSAQGTHEQLMASSSIYREIFESQLGGGGGPQ